jgi:TetR/AcrR family fatty acid metabolism transcriptional regulator
VTQRKSEAPAYVIPQELLEPRTLPKSGVRLAEALKILLESKDFNSITTAEIAETAGANEALIYRYFNDKRGLLHHVLAEHLKTFLLSLQLRLSRVQGPENRIRELIFSTIRYYHSDVTVARILLVEVRNCPGYFESDTYHIVKWYAHLLLELVHEGIEAGIVRTDVSPSRIRDVVLGGVEHLCLRKVIFGHDTDTDCLSRDLCEVIFRGIHQEMSRDGTGREMRPASDDELPRRRAGPRQRGGSARRK